MGDKDKTQKILEDYNDVFADIVNVLLFDGKEVVREDELETAVKESFYKADGRIREQGRDTAKFWKKAKVRIALIGLENQTKYDKYMPIRIIGYDGANYREQLNIKGKKEVYPVITLVLYFGLKHWKKNRSLKELFDIPKGLEKYFNDYKINVFEIAFLSKEQINKFKSDFRIVADYFVQKRTNRDYNPPAQKVKHVQEILQAMKAFTGDKRFEESYNESYGTEVSMGERWFDEAEARGEARGMAKLIEGALRNGNTPEQVAAFNNIPLERVLEVQKSMLQEA